MRRTLALLLLGLLTACAGGRPSAPPAGTGGGNYKIGQPYQIGGNWYYPREDYSYDETGIASWYGDDFHNLRTANGETFNKNELTAAHKTLPLPTLARVTNLDNGRSIVVRINDRGPFSGARIVDMSQRAAQLLGFEKQGTAKVRVQVMADESRAIADAMRRYGSDTTAVAAASAAAPESSATASVIPVTAQPLEAAPPPPSKAQAHAMMATFKPEPIVRQGPVTGPHQIFVQAGAFTQPENANKLKRKLESLGKVSVVQVNVKGTQYYRVRLGPAANVETADLLLKKVNRLGIAEARTVVD